MTHKREPEQITLAYRDYRSSAISRRASASERRREIIMSNVAENRQYKRAVSTPELIEEPPTWAERRARQARSSAPRTGHRQVQRTLARTGMAAPEGPVRVVKSLPRSSYTPIPVRSGG